jgi:hypothetical protein
LKIIERVVGVARTCRIEEIPFVFAWGLSEQSIGHERDTYVQ